MLFSFNWLNDYLTYEVSPQELAEVLTMRAFEVESVTKKGDDWVLDIDVLPNRAGDCFSHAGVAGEANALLGFLGKHQKKEGEAIHNEEETRAFFSGLAPSENLSITIEKKEDCSLYQLLLVEGVGVGKSPEWMRKRLEAVGLNSINNLVDISNYVMLDTGEPLHMFDADEVTRTNGKIHIIVRRAKEGEQIMLLGGENVKLSGEDLVIADSRKPLALAGIKGGQESGVKEKTRSILIESANFNRSLLYHSSKRLGILTDSAKRWSAGVSLDASFIALFKAVTLVKEFAKGGVAGYCAFLPASPSRELFRARPPIFVSLKGIQSLIGQHISEETMRSVLFHLGFDVKEESVDSYKISPPFWRLDCEREEDISEEVARFIGLNDIPPIFPSVSLTEPLDEKILQWRSFIKNYFVSQGFDEIYSYSLVGTKDEDTPSLLNPMSKERTHLRGDLTQGLLEVIASNQAHHSSIRLFEMGKTFSAGKGVIKEREIFAALVWYRSGEEAFREAKGYLSGLFEAMGFDEGDYLLKEEGEAIPSLAVEMGRENIGKVFIPTVLLPLKIKGTLAAFWVDVQTLIKDADQEREFEAPPKYPAVERDISLFLERGVKAGSVMQVIHEVGKELIEDVDLLDMYEEEGKPQKSLAFHIIYRSKKKTLRDEEVNTLHQTIEKALTKRFHAKVR